MHDDRRSRRSVARLAGIPKPCALELAGSFRRGRGGARRVGGDADQRGRARGAERADHPILRDTRPGEPSGRPWDRRDLLVQALPAAARDQVAANGRRDARGDHQGHARSDGRRAGAALCPGAGHLAAHAGPPAAEGRRGDAARPIGPGPHRLADARRRQGDERADGLAPHSRDARRRAARRCRSPARPAGLRRPRAGRDHPPGNRETPATQHVIQSTVSYLESTMWVLLILLVLAAFWVIAAYNGLISLKNQTVNAFKQIDVQLKRRHDLIPNLVNAVKGAMDFERSTLEAVIQARNQAVKVNASGPEAMKQVSQAENALSGALSRLMVVMEQYPQLKATGNIGQLQEELTSTENRIAFARQLYNDTATQYNTKQQQFPTTLVAGLAKAQPADLWEIEDKAERGVPQVDLSMKPKT